MIHLTHCMTFSTSRALKKKIIAQALWTEMYSCQAQLLGVLQCDKQGAGTESCQENDTLRKSAPCIFFFLGVNSSDDKPESSVWDPEPGFAQSGGFNVNCLAT